MEKINNIAGTELVLYSKLLGIAGTADCVAEYNGILSIIDYKTKRKPQKEEWLEDPFIQATSYSLMFSELTGINVEQIVVLVSVENGTTQEFIRSPVDYIDKLKSRIKEYKSLNCFR